MADDRRTSILEATLRVIVRDGAPETRVAAIAREAGVSNALPLYYFGSVHGTVRAAFALHGTRAWQRSDARLAAARDAPARLRVLLFDELRDDADARTTATLWREIERLAAFDRGIARDVRARRRRYDRSVADAIVACRDAGVVRRDVVPEDAAETLTALVDGLAIALRLGGRSRASVRRTLEAALQRELGLPPERAAARRATSRSGW